MVSSYHRGVGGDRGRLIPVDVTQHDDRERDWNLAGDGDDPAGVGWAHDGQRRHRQIAVGDDELRVVTEFVAVHVPEAHRVAGPRQCGTGSARPALRFPRRRRWRRSRQTPGRRMPEPLPRARPDPGTRRHLWIRRGRQGRVGERHPARTTNAPRKTRRGNRAIDRTVARSVPDPRPRTQAPKRVEGTRVRQLSCRHPRNQGCPPTLAGSGEGGNGASAFPWWPAMLLLRHPITALAPLPWLVALGFAVARRPEPRRRRTGSRAGRREGHGSDGLVVAPEELFFIDPPPSLWEPSSRSPRGRPRAPAG